MKAEDLKSEIEKEFGWLTPDEKQKLFSLLKSTWNKAIDECKIEMKSNHNYSNMMEIKKI